MAHRYLLMLYVYTFLLSIQLRSQYHKKSQVPWCWNNIVGDYLLSDRYIVFSVHIPNSKYVDIIFYLIGKIAWFYQCTYPVQNILTLSSIRSEKVHVFFFSHPGFPFEQTMSCHILYVVKMAHRYLLMLYVYTLLRPNTIRRTSPLVSKSYNWLIIFYLIGKIPLFFQCTSPIKKKKRTLSSIWSVKSTCFFLGGLLPTGVPLWTNHVLPYIICEKKLHIALLLTIQLRDPNTIRKTRPRCVQSTNVFVWAKVLKFIILGISSIWP